MSYPLSDDDSTDSDSGIRFKTTNTRNTLGHTSYKEQSKTSDRRNNSKYDYKRNRSRSRDRSSKDHRSTSRSRDYRNRRHRSKTPEKIYSSRDSGRNERSRSYDKSTSKRKQDKSYDNKYPSKFKEHKNSFDSEQLKNTSVSTRKYKSMDNSGKICNSRRSKSIDLESDNEQFGPNIPLQKEKSKKNDNINDIQKECTSSYSKRESTSNKNVDEKICLDNETYGPIMLSRNKIYQKEFESVKIGPKLFPSSHKEKVNSTKHSSDSSNVDHYGPSLPQKNETNISCSSSQDICVGPLLPPHKLKKTENEKNENIKKIETENILISPGPVIIKDSIYEVPDQNCKVIGPILPPHLRAAFLEGTDSIANIADDLNKKDSDSDDDIIGPLPAGQSSNIPGFIQLEERALQMKIDGLISTENDSVSREEWMLQLPQIHSANLGLGPRQFRAKGVPDMSDRSSWTDTPQDKAKSKEEGKVIKTDLKKEAELKYIKARDVEQAKMVEKHKKKKKRDKSLLDIHQDKIKKKKEENDKSERRPFNRDIDLKVNRFDEAQKKAILKKAQLLDNRFSSGESKFL